MSDQLPWSFTTSMENPTLLGSKRAASPAKAEAKTTLSQELFSLQKLMGSHAQAATRLSDHVTQLQIENWQLADQLAAALQGRLPAKDVVESLHGAVESHHGLQRAGTDSDQLAAASREQLPIKESLESSLGATESRRSLQRAGTDPCYSFAIDESVEPHKKLQRAGAAGIMRRAGTQPCVAFSSPHPSPTSAQRQPPAQRFRGLTAGWPTFDRVPSTTTRTTKQSTNTQKSSKQAAWPVFTDTDALKDRIKEVLTEEQHDITEHYHSSGLLQKIARSLAFERLCAYVVILSALWLSVEIDNDESRLLSEADPIFQVAAHLFCAFFVFEFGVRFGTFREKRRALQEIAILFDAGLLVLIILETWVLPVFMAVPSAEVVTNGRRTLSVFRVLRLLRTLRLARVLRQAQELLVIVRGIAIAFRAMIIILALLALVVYFAAIVFTILLQGTDLGERRFSSVPSSMGTLLLEGALSGSRGTHVIREANDEHPAFAALLLVFVLVANITIMGVLAGLLVQTVKTVSEVEREERAVFNITDKMEELWDRVVMHDDNGDGLIDVHELPCLLGDETLARSLHSVGIDLEGLVDISSLHLQQHAYLTKPQFKRMALEMRSKEFARVKDHVETRKFIHTHFQDFSTWSRKRRVAVKV